MCKWLKGAELGSKSTDTLAKISPPGYQGRAGSPLKCGTIGKELLGPFALPWSHRPKGLHQQPAAQKNQ